jgi:hypothetical protein
MEEALKGGAPVDEKDSSGWTGLHHAVAGERFDIVAFLLRMGADPTVKNNAGKSPLDFFKPASCPDLGIISMMNCAKLSQQFKEQAGAPKIEIPVTQKTETRKKKKKTPSRRP